MNNLPPCWPPQSTRWRIQRNAILRNILIGSIFIFMAFWMIGKALQ